MKLPRRSFLHLAAGAAALPAVSRLAWAQAYPTRPVHWIVGFPPGGVLALGEMNKPQWVYAEVDLDLIAKVRASGGVQTYKHWPEQPGAGALPEAQVVNISGA